MRIDLHEIFDYRVTDDVVSPWICFQPGDGILMTKEQGEEAMRLGKGKPSKGKAADDDKPSEAEGDGA